MAWLQPHAYLALLRAIMPGAVTSLGCAGHAHIGV
jgi:hypothetical protein